MRLLALIHLAASTAAATDIVATLVSSMEFPLGQPTPNSVSQLPPADVPKAVPTSVLDPSMPRPSSASRAASEDSSQSPSSTSQTPSTTSRVALILVYPAPAPSLAAAGSPVTPPSSTPSQKATPTHGSTESANANSGIDPGTLVGLGISLGLAGLVVVTALLYYIRRRRRNKRRIQDDEEETHKTWFHRSNTEKPRLPSMLLLGPSLEASFRNTFSTTTLDDASSAKAALTKDDLIANPAMRGHWRPLPPRGSFSSSRTSLATPPGFVTGGIGVAMSSRQRGGSGDTLSMIAKPGVVRIASGMEGIWLDAPLIPPSLASSSQRSSYSSFFG